MEIRTAATGPAVCVRHTHYDQNLVTVDPVGNPIRPPCSRGPTVG